jgi:UDP-N-acetylmuramoyl-tripeptide--D-alanyl-D-alanine ligase
MVGRKAAEVVDDLVTFGPLALTIAEEAQSTTSESGGRLRNVHSFGLDERDALVEFLRKEPDEGDVLLLKGSRGLEMEHIVSALRAVN